MQRKMSVVFLLGSPVGTVTGVTMGISIQKNRIVAVKNECWFLSGFPEGGTVTDMTRGDSRPEEQDSCSEK